MKKSNSPGGPGSDMKKKPQIRNSKQARADSLKDIKKREDAMDDRFMPKPLKGEGCPKKKKKKKK